MDDYISYLNKVIPEKDSLKIVKSEAEKFQSSHSSSECLTEQVIELKKMVSELKPPSSEKRVLIEIEDACRIIHKAKATVYTLVRKGILPAYKKGKKLYFYEDELLAWVENGRKKTSEQNYDEVLANMQSGMRRKPKPRTNF